MCVMRYFFFLDRMICVRKVELYGIDLIRFYVIFLFVFFKLVVGISCFRGYICYFLNLAYFISER